MPHTYRDVLGPAMLPLPVQQTETGEITGWWVHPVIFRFWWEMGNLNDWAKHGDIANIIICLFRTQMNIKWYSILYLTIW